MIKALIENKSDSRSTEPILLHALCTHNAGLACPLSCPTSPGASLTSPLPACSKRTVNFLSLCVGLHNVLQSLVLDLHNSLRILKTYLHF